MHTERFSPLLRQRRRQCAMVLAELLLLLPYGFDWLVYLSPGQIDFCGADVLIGALGLVIAAAVFILLKWSVGVVLLCHGILSLIPVFVFFGWGGNGFAYRYTFAEHLAKKIPMATPAFWAALGLPLLMGVIQLLCWEGEEKTPAENGK